MSAYNIQKRQTLDRLSSKHQLRMREVLRRHSSQLVADFVSSLNAGHESFKPKTKALAPKIERVLADHQDDVVHVAVSDGIQEVSPEKDLSLCVLDAWAYFPNNMPIETTLSADLAKTRDKIAKQVRTKFSDRFRKKLEELLDTHLDDYVGNLKKAYRKLAGSWIDGESTVAEATRAIKEALQSTDYEAARMFRTETTSYFNETRQDYFATNTAVDYMQIFAVTDGRISKICDDRHRFVITIVESKLKKYMPAFHPHCRTILRPLISKLPTHKKMIDFGLDMNEASFTPLPKGWA